MPSQPPLSTLEIKDMVPSEAVMPIHPGALNYYREAGLVHNFVLHRLYPARA